MNLSDFVLQHWFGFFVTFFTIEVVLVCLVCVLFADRAQIEQRYADRVQNIRADLSGWLEVQANRLKQSSLNSAVDQHKYWGDLLRVEVKQALRTAEAALTSNDRLHTRLDALTKPQHSWSRPDPASGLTPEQTQAERIKANMRSPVSGLIRTDEPGDQ